MSNHHKYSPSKYPAWSQCVHYDPAQTTSSEAKQGTDAHNELELDLNGIEEASNPTVRWAVEQIKLLVGDDMSMLKTEIRLEADLLHNGDNIFGKADIAWIDSNGVLHIGDFKTFSDGTKDYIPQLKGYAALYNGATKDVVLHVFHGGSKKVETVETTINECIEDTVKLLKNVIDKDGERRLCDWCQYCSKIKECPMSNNAVQVVSDNSLTFSNLSLPQKLVILDTVDKLSSTLRKQAKELAEANGGVLEADGIRYELKPWAGKAKVRDIYELAYDVQRPTITDKNGNEIHINGIPNNDFIKLCDIGKTKVVEAICEANADNKSVKKVYVERWVSERFEKTEGAPHFVRTM